MPHLVGSCLTDTVILVIKYLSLFFFPFFPWFLGSLVSDLQFTYNTYTESYGLHILHQTFSMLIISHLNVQCLFFFYINFFHCKKHLCTMCPFFFFFVIFLKFFEKRAELK